jgi:4-amino-4-deoxy-L-arabinose transferase-like glycosyltransferase
MRTSVLQYLYFQKPVTVMIIVCATALLPWLGSDFYTKGEPREASVAISMLESGNWILPEVYAGEFAYKPPMAHWLMAVFSLPQGHVSEFTSRLPSALAQIILLGCVLAFFGKRIRFQEAFVATLLLLTCFEIHRAGMTARVDMLLTTFTILGLMQLYRWENRLELKGLPVLIPLLFSCAVLTKGPAGIVLPLFIFFVYLLLLRRYRFGKILKSLVYIGISSAFIPMLWYVEAYRQGGEAFLNVALAENFGRFFHLDESAIRYDLGHEEGVFYNFITLLSGFIPWTLLLVFSLFGAKWRLPYKSFRQIMKEAWQRFSSMEKMKRFSLAAAVCIVFFYTIPSSKRSVYLMPAYPFLSILLAQYFIYITENRPKVTRAFAYVLTGIASTVFIAGLSVMTQAADFNAIAAKFTAGEAALNAVGSITSLLAYDAVTSWVIMALLLVSILTTVFHLTGHIHLKVLYATILLTFGMNLFIDGIVMRSIKDDTSARPFAEQISRDYEPDNNLFVMNNLREYQNLYGMNFYMNNVFRDFEKEKPVNGYFLTTEKDVRKVLERYGSQYKFDRLAVSGRQGDIRSKAVLFRFSR